MTADQPLTAARLALACQRARAADRDADLLASEPIAVIGIGCRFPGGADSPEAYWQLLLSGRNAVGPVPADRWPGMSSTQALGGFLASVDKFDADFFGLTPAEAAAMDPQHRLLLEVAWEAIWDAGIAPEALRGTDTGVFMSVYHNDYARLALRPDARVDAYTTTGTSHALAAGRISYLLDIHGPSLVVDTACSSSLVATHVACRSLRARECRVAIVGGSNLILTQDHMTMLERIGMLSPSGRSRTFDAGADGMGLGEGSGVVILKPLVDAIGDGDRVYAVIRGTAVNQDGQTSVVTAPNGRAQEAAISAALSNARVDPAAVTYVECHGTGTPLGDPVEVGALAATVGRRAPGALPCAIGSAKACIGHLEAAAGISGLIKAALALFGERIPPQPPIHTFNPHLGLEGSRLFVPLEASPWPRGGRPRFAGVSGFGAGGTNAHIVLEEAPVVDAPRAVRPPRHTWNRTRHWISTEATGAREPASILGKRLRSAALREVVVETRLDVHATPWLADHVVGNAPVLSATAIVQVLAAAASEAFPGRRVALGNVAFDRPLSIADSGTTAQVVFDGEDFVLYVLDGDAWIRHTSGRLLEPGPPAARRSPEDLRRHLPRETDAATIYARLAGAGLGLGPSYRSLERVWAGEREAVGRARLPRGSAPAPDLPIHPGLLDGCMHVAAAAVDMGEGDLYMPVGIDRLEIFRPASGALFSHVRVHERGDGAADLFVADVDVFSEDGAPVARLAGHTWKRVAKGASASLAETLYAPVWVRKSLAGAAHGPRSFASRMRPTLGSVIAESGLAGYDGLRPELDALVAGYARLALATLARTRSAARPDGRFDAVLGRLERLAAARPDEARDSDELDAIAEGLASRFPSFAPEVELTRLCGSRLAPILRGEVDPLTLLFPGGSQDRLQALHGESPAAHATGRLAREAVQDAIGSMAGRSRVRLLEIGGGTGGTTAFVKDACEGRDVEYLFTDVSPLFVERARERFGASGAFRFATLDIERDPASEGYPKGSFDVVVAANVLHATAEIRRTLAHTRHLLAPGGWLVLVEGTRPDPWVDVTFGLTDGWWKFRGNDAARIEQPLLDPESWKRELERAGFAEIEALEVGGPNHQSVIVARATSSPRAATGVLLVGDGAGVAPALASRFHDLGLRADVLAPGEPCSAQRTAAYGDVVFLRALDMPAVETLTLAAFEDALESCCGALLDLVRALVTSPSTPPRLWVVTRAAQSTMRDAHRPVALEETPVLGMCRTIALEHPELRCTRVDVEDADPRDVALSLSAEIVQPDGEDEIALRGDERLVRRLERLVLDEACEPRRVVVSAAGSLDGLSWVAASRRSPARGEVEVEVDFAALNFRDVLGALGAYPGGIGDLGGELGGTVVAVGEGVHALAIGDPVVGLAEGSLASFVTLPATSAVRRPANIDPESAVTLPAAFATAHHALVAIADLRAGQTVLIHSAAGGVGLAAIQLARHLGAHVLATAGSARKRRHLIGLGVEHVFDSRTTAFAERVREVTEGRGVDVVLNWSTGAVREATLGVVADGGCFVELGKIEVLDSASVRRLGERFRYAALDLLEEARRDAGLFPRLLARVMALADRSVIQPLPRTVFAARDVATAFRDMAAARHVGKHVVRVGRRPWRYGDGAWLVTGGLGGLGLLTAEWLFERGARELVLMARSAPSASSLAAIERLRALGAHVTILQGDVAVAEDAAAAVAEAARAPGGLRGVVHAAGLLDDGAVVTQTWPRMRSVLAPKVFGALLLDRLLSGTATNLVLYSSMASLIGSEGQVSHAAANAFLDALAHERRRRGRAATSVNWGVWAEIGAAARLGMGAKAGALGIGEIAPADGLSSLDRLLGADVVQAGVSPIDWPRFLDRFGVRVPPLYAWFSASSEDRRPAEPTRPRTRFSATLAAEAPADRHGVLVELLREHVLTLLGKGPETTLEADQPLFDFGLDSLMAIELRNVLAREMGTSMTAMLVYDHPSLSSLASFLVRDEAPRVPGGAAHGGGDPDVESIRGMSEAEAEALLIAELERHS